MNEHAHEFRRINLVQGEYKVSDDPEIVFTTILGSCVGACIRDPVRGIGGMNHFLLPGPKPSAPMHARANASAFI